MDVHAVPRMQFLSLLYLQLFGLPFHAVAVIPSATLSR
jgi:hypothetical protein